MKFGLEKKKGTLNKCLQLFYQTCFYFFLIAKINCSNAATILGVCGCGAFISSLRPASSTALIVLLPNALSQFHFAYISEDYQKGFLRHLV